MNVFPAEAGPELAPQRLTRALWRLGIPFSAIRAVAGDVSSRRYFRVWAGDRTFVACLYPEPFDETESARDRWFRLCQTEPAVRLGFASDPLAYVEVTAWLTETNIPVPAIKGVAGAFGCIVTEDVGDRSLEKELHHADFATAFRLYSKALEYVQMLQLSTAEATRRGLVACSLTLDEEKLTHELGFLARALRSFLPHAIGVEDMARLQGEWSAIALEAADEPMVLCHRDYHARNLFLRGDTLMVIDHQDMRLGSRHYDAVSLLWDPYVDVSQELRQQLMPATDGHIAAIVSQRLLKALGTYLNVLITRASPVFIAAADRALRSLTGSLAQMDLSTESTEAMICHLQSLLRARYGVQRGSVDCPNLADKE
ncbi:phosphotransferase [Candidatus Fermentibacteria bacterium]|nr:phosphotransferase [Candidatus Fermentibacteria bacterium]